MFGSCLNSAVSVVYSKSEWQTVPGTLSEDNEQARILPVSHQDLVVLYLVVER